MNPSPASKFAFILHADVVGSTMLVQRDERMAHQRMQAAFQKLAAIIDTYQGKAREIRGDALVAEFARASDAVCAALAFQHANQVLNEGYEHDLRIDVRVGIGMGEVVIADNTVTGAGVVMAQRLEQLAKPGGVVIQGAVQEAIPQRLAFDYHDLGEKQLKGFDTAVRTFAVNLAPGVEIPRAEKSAHGAAPRGWFTIKKLGIFIAVVCVIAVNQYFWRSTPVPEADESRTGPASEVKNQESRPVIAVLPFDNISGDEEQEYFSDGMSEDIITDLSRLSNLDVIARNSSFTYKNNPAKVQDIGKDLGASHILEGSVRKAGKRIRINAQLIDAASGNHLWAERYDREITHIFELQDEITRHIVSALSIQLSEAEEQGINRAVSASFDAYDIFLQAQRSFSNTSRESTENTIDLYRQAITLAPDFSRPYGGLAIVLIQSIYRGYSDAPNITGDRAMQMAKKAVTLDPDSHHAHWALGYAYMYKRDFNKALKQLQKAISISPSYADGYGLLGLIYNNIGRPEEAIKQIEKGMSLNPYYTWDYLYNLGRAHYFMNNFETAIGYLERAINRNEGVFQPRIYLIACLVQLGQLEDAEWQVTELEVINSNLTVSHIERASPIGNQELRDRLYKDLRAAGMAE